MNTLRLAAEIARRVPAMANDCAQNNATVINSLIREEMAGENAEAVKSSIDFCSATYAAEYDAQRMKCGSDNWIWQNGFGKFTFCPYCGRRIEKTIK